MIEYSAQVNNMCPITKGPKHGPAPIPEEGEWVKAYKIEDISGYTHGVGWCAPQQGTCKLSLNIKNGIIEEALVETIGCSGMMRLPVHRHLPLAHRLQQCRLHFRIGTVDFVGDHDIGEKSDQDGTQRTPWRANTRSCRANRPAANPE